MSRSAFKWIAVFENGSTESVSATTAENAMASLNGDPDYLILLARQDLA